MAEATKLTMLAENTYTDWLNQGGDSKQEAVNDSSTADYIYEGVENDAEGFTLTGYAVIPSHAVISHIEHYMQIQEESGTHGWGVRPIFRLGGTNTNGTQRNTTASWVGYTETLARPGGGIWTYADLSTLLWCVQTQGTADGHAQRCCYGYATVHWELPNSGFFVWL